MIDPTKYESIQKRWFTVNFKNVKRGRTDITTVLNITADRYGHDVKNDLEKILQHELKPSEFYCGSCMSIKNMDDLTDFGKSQIVDRTGKCAACIEKSKQKYYETHTNSKAKKESDVKQKITTPLNPEMAKDVDVVEEEVPAEQLEENTFPQIDEEEEIELRNDITESQALRAFGWEVSKTYTVPVIPMQEAMKLDEELADLPNDDIEEETEKRSEESTDHMFVQGPNEEELAETTAPRRTSTLLGVDAHKAMTAWMTKRDTESAIELFKHMIQPKPVTLYYTEVILKRGIDIQDKVRRNWFEITTPFHKILFCVSDVQPTEEELTLLKEHSLNYFLYTM